MAGRAENGLRACLGKGWQLWLHLRRRRRQQRGGLCAHRLRLLARLLGVALLDTSVGSSRVADTHDKGSQVYVLRVTCYVCIGMWHGCTLNARALASSAARASAS